MSFLGALGGLVSGPIDTVLKTRKAKVEAKLAIYDRIKTGELEWEAIHARNSGKSWKDEWFTVIFSIPAMMCFVPGLREAAHQGFIELALTPEFYRYALMTLVGASVGIRGIASIVKPSK